MPSATNHSIDAPREHQNTTKQQEKKSNLVGSCRWRRAAGGRAVCPRLPGRRPVLRRVIVALRGTPYASRASCVRGRSAIELDAIFRLRCALGAVALALHSVGVAQGRNCCPRTRCGGEGQHQWRLRCSR